MTYASLIQSTASRITAAQLERNELPQLDVAGLVTVIDHTDEVAADFANFSDLWADLVAILSAYPKVSSLDALDNALGKTLRESLTRRAAAHVAADTLAEIYRREDAAQEVA